VLRAADRMAAWWGNRCVERRRRPRDLREKGADGAVVRVAVAVHHRPLAGGEECRYLLCVCTIVRWVRHRRSGCVATSRIRVN